MLALNSLTVDSRSVLNCINKLNKLAECGVDITISWIKAHVNYMGNELADNLAKEGAQSNKPPIIKRLTKSYIKNMINEAYYTKWEERWQKAKEYRQTKIWFPVVDPHKAAKLLDQPRDVYSRLVRWITGHNFLKRHSALLNPDTLSTCRFCELEEETSSHIIAECQVWCHQRQSCFQLYFLKVTEPTWKVGNLISFLKLETIAHLEDSEEDSTQTPNQSPHRAARDP